jgi:thioredoxin reductase
MPAESGLRVGIIGAGVVGLSAAIGLRRAGHNVEVMRTYHPLYDITTVSFDSKIQPTF